MPDPTDPTDRTRSHEPDPTPGPGADLTGQPTEIRDPVAAAAAAAGLPVTDRFRLVGEIARGGIGVVYRARDLAFDRDVAVKVLQGRFAHDSPVARRFVREARIAAQLQHPGVPAVHKAGTLPDGRPFLAMKLVEGRTLADLLAERPDPAHDRGHFLAAFEHVCQAVAYAHRNGVIHRDLKPGNVMVGAFGEVQVMDWGLAKVLGSATIAGPDPEAGDADDPAWVSTQAGAILGTPAFMSPEQAGGDPAGIDRRADVFGLGAILCVVLTGSPPYTGPNTESVREMAARGDLAECFARLDGCGAEPGLVGLAKRCLAANPADRPADAEAVAAAVAELREHAEERARRAEREKAAAEGRVAAERKRRRVQFDLTVIALLLTVGIGAAAWTLEQRTAGLRRQSEEAGRDREAAAGRARAGVENALGRLPDLYRRALWDQADQSVAEAGRLLGPEGDPELRARVEAARRDAAVGRQLDRIRLDKAKVVRGRPDEAAALPRYEAAFRDYGMDVLAGNPADLAARINASPVRVQLLAALDDWGMTDQDRARRVRIFAATAAATGYRWRHRLADAWGDRALLAEVYASVPPDQRTPALVYEVAARLGGSVPILEEGVRQFPSDFWLHLALGTAGGPDRAEARVGACRAAIALRPGVPLVYSNLSANLLARADRDGAEWAAREAVRLDPNNVTARINLGTVLQMKKDHAGAEREFREAVRLDPEDLATRAWLGNALWALGDLGGAEAEVRAAIRIGEESRAGARPESITRIDLRVEPGLGIAYGGLGRLLLEQGKFAESAAACRRATEALAPGHSARTAVEAGTAEADRLTALDAGLAAFDRGVRPASPAEAVRLVEVAVHPARRAYGAAVRLSEWAFAADPALAEGTVFLPDPYTRHRHRAARAAACAAAGRDPTLTVDIEEWGRLTDLAHRWLRADLAAWTARAAGPAAGDPKRAADIASWLDWWKRDPDFAAVRDPAWLAAMPPPDRGRWEAFWADVDALRASLTRPTAPPPHEPKRP